MAFSWRVIACFGALFVVSGSASAIDTSQPPYGDPRPAAGVKLTAESGTVTLRLNDHFLRELGVRLDGETAERDVDGYIPVRTTFAGTLGFTPEGSGIKKFFGGEAKVRFPLAFVRADGARLKLSPLTLVPGSGESLLVAKNADGETLFEFAMVHHKLWGATRVELANADIRIAPAFAEWIGDLRHIDGTIGQFDLAATVRAPENFPLAPKFCPIVYWPGTNKPASGPNPGGTAIVDTRLIRLGDSPGSSLAAECDASQTGGVCSGTTDARNVKLTPAATIENSEAYLAADVPWYPMFNASGRPGVPAILPPPTTGQQNYPYATLDQHPKLVWAAYRINANNQIEQIGRSGVKHAFLTINRSCLPDGCDQSGFILGRGCDDIYSIGNNNSNSVLGVRAEVDPGIGRWGRCNSTFDSNCDGVRAGGDASGTFDRRLMVSASALNPTLNPGTEYFIEAWYIVRDQANPLNAMGSQRFTPSFTSSWAVPVVTSGTGAFRQGATIDRWVDPATPSATARNVQVSAENGRFKVAVRVTPISGGRFRYDYAVFNVDFARTVAPTSGPGSQEPNLCVASNAGFAGFSVPVVDPAEITGISHFDNGVPANDDWAGATSGGAVAWNAPAPVGVTRCGLNLSVSPNTLDFGTLFRFSFESAGPPVSGNVALTAATGDTTPFIASVIVPGASDTLLSDGFE